jgi:hypothetical protein
VREGRLQHHVEVGPEPRPGGIEAVAKIGDKFRVLDLKEAATRASVSAATTIRALYESADAFDYLP